jgi:anaerobic selenocysteine-containing dehydrogenase
MEWVHRSCPICEAQCGLRLHVDRANRKVERIEGDPDDPRSGGFLCPKAYALKGVYEDPDRLRKPLRRTKAGWETLDWEDAFDLAAEGIRRVQTEQGPAAVAAYIGNPTGFDVGSMLYNGLLMGALRSPRMFSGATIDHFPKLVVARAMFGKSSLLPIPDLERCDYFLCLGGNPLVSQGSLMSAPDMRGRLRRLRERGGRFVVVDPRRTESARAADEHVFIRPGADAFFLFAIAHVLFAEQRVRLGRFAAFTDGVDEVLRLARDFSPEAVAGATGIPAETTRRIAREFSDHPHACCYGRIGTCTVEFGTLASWLVDVVNILAGRYDEPGGMMFPRPATGQHEPGGESGPLPIGRFRSVVRSLPEIDGQLPCSAMAEEIDAAGEQRIRGLVTIAGNPVLSTPNGRRLDRALATLDFMLSLDIYLNETTRHAHLVIPNAPQLEHENFDFLIQSTASSRNSVRWSPQVFEREPDSRCLWEVERAIAARLLGATPEQLEEQLVWSHATRFCGRPGRPAECVEAEQAVARIGREPGPMRILDLMLRAGPWGDGFDDSVEGLSLAKVRAVPHALDLGPIEPCFPQVLRTPGRRIPLAHPHLTGDVARLRAALVDPGWGRGLRLIGRRQMRNMNSWLHNLPVLARGPERCTLLVHPEDAQRLGLTDGGHASVRSRVGEVRAQVEVTDDMMPGVVCLPHGFGHDEQDVRQGVARANQPGVNANALTDDQVLDVPSNTSVVNGVPVEVFAA